MGGMRRSKATNSLILVLDHTKHLYNDRWKDNVLYYTGMGRQGNQSLKRSQNKTLAESDWNGVQVYLFEVYKRNEYIFRGRVKLFNKPYPEEQIDVNGNTRQVWIFPLVLY